MITANNDDAEYPYSRSGSSALKSQVEIRAHLLAQARFWEWALRLATVCGVALAIALVSLGVLGYRVAAMRQRYVNLSSWHCIVTYWQEPVVDKCAPGRLAPVVW